MRASATVLPAEGARLRHALPRVQREVHGECAAEDGALGSKAAPAGLGWGEG